MRFQPKNLWACLLLMGVWAMAVWATGPIGDFPLNDDFSYGKTVFNLVEKGVFQFDEWLAMTLVSQVLWGAAFCKIFGFSFTVLRFSTLLLAYFALCGGYFLCRELGQSRKAAFLVALVLAFNPFFFSLSFTFMTDVPFFAFSIWAILFYVKALKHGNIKWVVAGTFFALAATFVRQTGLMLPAAFGVAWLFRGKWTVAAAPMALTLLLFFLFSTWLDASQGLPDGYGNFQKLFKRSINGGFFLACYQRIGVLAIYLGVFLLPLLGLLKMREVSFFKKNRWAIGGLALFFAGAFFFAWQRLPFGNLLFNLGLGPKLLKDGYVFQNISPTLPGWVLTGLKVVSILAGIWLLSVLLPAIFLKIKKSDPVRLPVIFALSGIGFYVGFLFLDKHFFDRYYFQLLPFVLICLLAHNPLIFNKKWAFVAIMVLGLQAVFSIAATHDYLSWNRARWTALDWLTKEKDIPPNRIDGGFEFNGWHKPAPIDRKGWKSWWWVDKDDYVVAFGEIPNFQKTKAFPFQKWLPPSVDSVYVLEHE